MNKFIYSNSPYKDILYEEFIKRLKGKGDFENYDEGYLRSATRFLNKNYITQLNSSVTQNVIIKIITKGATKQHLNTLLDYVSRNLESQKSEEEAMIYDQNNEIIDKANFKEFTDSWLVDFDDYSISKDDKEIIEKIDLIKNDLNDKYYLDGLNKDQSEFFQAIKIYEKAKFSKDKFYNGAICVDKNTNNIGIVLADKYKENANFFCISHYPYISKSIKPLESLQPINRDIRKISYDKPKNFTHMILSAGGDNPNPNTVLEATRDFLEENIKSKGHNYAYTLHTDTKNPHVHVIVNNHSKQNDYKYSLGKYELQEMRFDYTRHLDGYGVNRSAILKYDRKNSLNIAMKEIQNNENHNLDWYEYKLNDNKDKNFDLLKFKKKFLATSENLARNLEKKGQVDMAKKVKEQARNIQEVEKSNIPKVIENTMHALEKDNHKFRKYYERTFMKNMGKPSDYQKNSEIEEKMVKQYEKHLETTREDLEKLNQYKLPSELQSRLDKAIRNTDKKIHQLDVKLDRGYEREGGRSR